MPIPVEVTSPTSAKIQNTPKWTASGTLNYDTPLAGRELNLNSTLHYRSKSQQFEIAHARARPEGLLAARRQHRLELAGDRCTIGLHGKNLTNTHYITAGYNFLAAEPLHRRVHPEIAGRRHIRLRRSAARAC